LSSFWAQGKRITRTYYHHDRMTWRDVIVIVVCLGASATLVWFRVVDAASLLYYPYTDLMPPFQPAIGVTLLTLILPAIIERRS
jgi:hypothetical protein